MGVRRRNGKDQRVRDLDRLRRNATPTGIHWSMATRCCVRPASEVPTPLSARPVSPRASPTSIHPGRKSPQVYVGNNGEPPKPCTRSTPPPMPARRSTTGIIGIEPNGIAVTPEGTKIVVAEGASHQVQIITVSSHTVAATVAIPEVARHQIPPGCGRNHPQWPDGVCRRRRQQTRLPAHDLLGRARHGDRRRHAGRPRGDRRDAERRKGVRRQLLRAQRLGSPSAQTR